LSPVSCRVILAGRLVTLASLAAPGRPERGVAAGARGSQQIAGKCRHRRYSRARRAAGRPGGHAPGGRQNPWQRPHDYSGHACALSGARDYCPRIPGHEFSAVSTEQGPAAPSSLAPGMPAAGNAQRRECPAGLRECLDTAASAASGGDDPRTACAAGRASRRRSRCPPPLPGRAAGGGAACDQ
jgi:hypothetical protein